MGQDRFSVPVRARLSLWFEARPECLGQSDRKRSWRQPFDVLSWDCPECAVHPLRYFGCAPVVSSSPLGVTLRDSGYKAFRSFLLLPKSRAPFVDFRLCPPFFDNLPPFSEDGRFCPPLDYLRRNARLLGLPPCFSWWINEWIFFFPSLARPRFGSTGFCGPPDRAVCAG